ncbi:MAG: protein kinase [Candidatus Latescibacterota bacterium]|nr:MAG: protein kinase [Candidatus Latescibacterota bacterium]
MIGKTVLHYKITEKLGQGGMGVVFKAEDTKLNRTVALKFLPPNALANEEDKARFVHEARAAAALHHPNICTVYEINETEGQTFISMAYLPGGSLKDKIQEGPLSIAEILDVAVGVARGLKAAHDKGVIHRDIKPSNIMFSESDEVTVMDFGLAKSKQQTVVTKVRTTVGTVAYMSPEQTRGDEVDFRTDIWSLGVILYEMTTGQRPFRGDYDEAVIYSILNEPPKLVTELREDADPDLVRIIEKATAKDAGERYGTIDEMLADLEFIRNELRSGVSRISSATRSRFAPPQPPSLAKRLLSPGVLLPVVAAIVVAAIAVVFFGRKGGVVTETVAVTDERGQTIERIIPKNEYRKSFAVYFFDNKSGDPAHDWVQMAIAILLETDLLQDQMLTLQSSCEPYAIQKMQRAGFTSWEQAPWSLKLRIAKESHVDYIVTGSFTVENGEYVIKRLLHEVSRGRLIAEKTHRGGDLYALIDDIAVVLKEDLAVPDSYIEELADLPIKEMMTSSSEALESFSVGLKDWIFEQNWDSAQEALERSVEQDSTFAYAHFQLTVFYLYTNQSEKTERALQSVMRYLYKMPERIQFLFKSIYYALKKDPEKQEAVLRMMVELYPNDVIGRHSLAAKLAQQNRTNEAIEQYEKILEIDPGRSGIIQIIGGLYRDKGDFDKALEYYESYAEQHPDVVNSFTEIAAIYRDLGDYDEATRYYDKALLIEPENISVLRSLAGIDARLGKADAALAKYHDAIKMSKAPEDRLAVYSSLQTFHTNRGEMQKALNNMNHKWDEAEKTRPPLSLLMMRLLDARFIAKAGRVQDAFEAVDSISRKLEPPFDDLAPLGYVYLYLEIEEPDSAERSLERLNVFIETYQDESLRDYVYWTKGRVAELRGEFREAIKNFEKKMELDPTDSDVHWDIGRCYRKLGDYETAEESLGKMLKIYPMDPDCLYELALVYAEKGETDKATETLKKALSVWENADPVYEPAKKARQKLAEWTS